MKLYILALLGMISISTYHIPANPVSFPAVPVVIDPQDSFPVPGNVENQLFYLQRTHNINTIICQLNPNRQGDPSPEAPVHVFWIRYTENGVHAELSFIQRVFAYGIKSKAIGKNKYELHFVAYKKYLMYLMQSPADHKYHVYAMIARKNAILKRIFVKINGGSFWSPNVEYVELRGTDAASGKELIERVKV